MSPWRWRWCATHHKCRFIASTPQYRLRIVGLKEVAMNKSNSVSSQFIPFKLLKGTARKARFELLRKEEEAKALAKARTEAKAEISKEIKAINKRSAARKEADQILAQEARNELLRKEQEISRRAAEAHQKGLKKAPIEGFGQFPFVGLADLKVEETVEVSVKEMVVPTRDYYLARAERAMDQGSLAQAERLLALAEAC